MLHCYFCVLLVLVFNTILALVTLIAIQLLLPILIDHTLCNFFVMVYLLPVITPVGVTCPPYPRSLQRPYSRYIRRPR